MYHHRGAYLQAVAMAYHTALTSTSRYLWTLPMFHCDGWCFTWAVSAAGATHICLRRTDPALVWELLDTEAVTHFSAAPTVLTMIAEEALATGRTAIRSVAVQTGGAPPSPTILGTFARLGMPVTHLYGLTETFGPIALNQWRPAWDDLPAVERDRLNARQGVGNVISSGLHVVDTTGADVTPDGKTVGEIACRGNDVMLGYFNDPEGTAAAVRDGLFRTGDLGVLHPDGYVEIVDRAKDIIISGGENIASVEIERALDSHPSIVESAVVGRHDAKWGEVPVAYVVYRKGEAPTSEEVITYLRDRIAHFKVPKSISAVDELPKTSTGKIQKDALRRLSEPDERDA
jgi:fatty-acyl-CoA synthase